MEEIVYSTTSVLFVLCILLSTGMILSFILDYMKCKKTNDRLDKIEKRLARWENSIRKKKLSQK